MEADPRNFGNSRSRRKQPAKRTRAGIQLPSEHHMMGAPEGGPLEEFQSPLGMTQQQFPSFGAQQGAQFDQYGSTFGTPSMFQPTPSFVNFGRPTSAPMAGAVPVNDENINAKISQLEAANEELRDKIELHKNKIMVLEQQMGIFYNKLMKLEACESNA